jgi:hypothetical protein
MSRSVNPWGVYVLHPSIQATGILVRPLLNGSADALRVSQKALPTEGTWGVVLWPYGDSRNGVWLGSLYTQGNDALLPTSADVDYEAHPSGAYTLLDQNGNFTFSFPDGSALQVGATGGAPELTRHVVNAAQFQVPIAYPNTTRAAAAPTPFPAQYTSASGTSLTIDVAGNVDIKLNPGAKLNITDGGSPSLLLSLVEPLVTWLLNHTHGGVQTGGGASGVPSQALTDADIASTLIGIQS